MTKQFVATRENLERLVEAADNTDPGDGIFVEVDDIAYHCSNSEDGHHHPQPADTNTIQACRHCGKVI